MELVGDSDLVIRWLNGLWRCKYNLYAKRLAILHSCIQSMVELFGIRPRSDDADWGRHIFRELNCEADALAGVHRFAFQEHSCDTNWVAYRLFFDGSCTESGAGGGWVLYGSRHVFHDSLHEWEKLADLSFALGTGATVTAAELESCSWGVSYLKARLQGIRESHDNIHKWRTLDTSRCKILTLAELLD